MPTLAVLGAGPGLGLSIARRFQREGYATALVSRRGFQADNATGYAADLTDLTAVPDVLAKIREDLGPIDTLYFGPATTSTTITALDKATPADVRAAIDAILLPATAAVTAALPEARSILLAGGLSGRTPMPMLGSLAPASAALRMYALTLNEALTETYVGTLTIGGLIRGGDIHAMVSQQHPEMPTLDPDDMAETAWRMVHERGPAEVVFS